MCLRGEIPQDRDKGIDSRDLIVRCCPGEPGDRVHFSEFILANTRLYALRNDKTLSTRAVANFTRSELATALRKVSRLPSFRCYRVHVVTSFNLLLQHTELLRSHLCSSE